ncbi:hypothetical protein VOLCADRAFT_94353 [Volvox carteri f. nagariensis]|uniref:SCP domain-containing protein n=1 Tax=Volvox carteri f. nagariensis TaxID=3068 RepID=D8U4K0_VOLCA|nr:uncharacterized protein VOLCADRAFT_94353 [Volvox carteri f. nagariensis]EFJ45286.1 hypothetical protein VOLCADRAFT_94353 [Volvox carteri f. nagariensis]|eukprot:XP_002953662.1 hypothetical protein VOLCADRAFT_94353 [Volvox carteri f. nagariensis]
MKTIARSVSLVLAPLVLLAACSPAVSQAWSSGSGSSQQSATSWSQQDRTSQTSNWVTQPQLQQVQQVFGQQQQQQTSNVFGSVPNAFQSGLTGGNAAAQFTQQCENLAWGYSDAKSAIDAYYSEGAGYAYGVSQPADWHSVGHFTQVIWKASTDLGCAVATCNGGQQFQVCRYSPPGNVQGQYAENVLPPST